MSNLLNLADDRIGRSVRVRALLGGIIPLALLLMAAGSVEAGESTRLDLNRATVAELESLPGIGAAKAAAIVARRKTVGHFRSVDDLESVRGIGPVLIEQLRPRVEIGSSVQPASQPASRAASKTPGAGAAKRPPSAR